MAVKLESIELCKWHTEPVMPEQGVAKLFGYWLRQAGPVVVSYPSDFYRDVKWLRKHARTDGFEFYLCADAGGTHIGTSDVILEYRTDLQVKVTVRHDDAGVWYAVIDYLRGEPRE